MDRKKIILAAAILGLGFTIVCGIFLALSVFMAAYSFPWDSSVTEAGAATNTSSPTRTPSPTTIQDLFPSATPASTPITRPSATFASYPVVVDSWCAPWNTERTKGFVTRAISADTIEVYVNGEFFEVRYIGLEAPAASVYGEAMSEAATKKNQELVEGKTVLLIKDVSDTDEGGRLLRYVISGVYFINREILEMGYASAISNPPDLTCDVVFQESQRLAKAQSLGIWSQAPLETQIPTAIFPSTQTTPTQTTATPTVTQSLTQPTVTQPPYP
jgi:endonuclease YncB( thermonuclease family)